MRISVILLLWVAAWLSPALAADTDTSYICDEADVRTVKFTDVVADPAPFIGQCVRMRALTSWYYLYEGVPQYYEAIAGEGRERKRVPFVGMYAPEGLEDTLFTGRKIVEVVGRLHTCEQDSAIANAHYAEAEARGEVEVVWMFTGFCHYHLGPVIYVARFTELPVPTNLIPGDPASEALRNLVPIENDWPHAYLVRRRAEAWFDAVRRRDVEAFVKINTDSEVGDLNEINSMVRQVFVTNALGTQFLFGLSAVPEIRYFRKRQEPGDKAGGFIAGGCVCKTENCSNEWPMHVFDIRLAKDLPIACIWVEREDGKIFVGR